jgi:intracellular sulfur oxidation DsrE/DsrF family protein
MTDRTQTGRRGLLGKLATLGLSLPALTAARPAAAEAAPARPRHRTVAYHISDHTRAIKMMRNLGAHRAADATAVLVVVAFGGGVDFLLDGAMDEHGNSYEAIVDTHVAAGVKFRVCNNTLVARDIKREQLLPDVEVVPSGVAELTRLQCDEGAAYIKP